MAPHHPQIKLELYNLAYKVLYGLFTLKPPPLPLLLFIPINTQILGIIPLVILSQHQVPPFLIPQSLIQFLVLQETFLDLSWLAKGPISVLLKLPECSYHTILYYSRFFLPPFIPDYKILKSGSNLIHVCILVLSTVLGIHNTLSKYLLNRRIWK